jgi:hypothetical protein
MRLRVSTFNVQHDEGHSRRTSRAASRFLPEVGGQRVGDVDEASIDPNFGRKRRAGLSASRLHDARNASQRCVT